MLMNRPLGAYLPATDQKRLPTTQLATKLRSITQLRAVRGCVPGSVVEAIAISNKCIASFVASCYESSDALVTIFEWASPHRRSPLKFLRGEQPFFVRHLLVSKFYFRRARGQ